MNAPVCHPDRRHKAFGLCYACYSTRKNRERWANTPEQSREERRIARRALYVAEHPPRPRLSESEVARRRPMWRLASRAKALGLGRDALRDMVARQAGRCAICGQEPVGRRLDLDHDHATGKVRGLLCRSCNLAIGYMQDDPLRLVTAARYLEAA